MDGLDIFFANAGVSGGFASIAEQTAEDWAEILRVNLIGPFLAIKHAAPLMRERGGSIICTASVAGLRSGAGGAAYSASKAGVINLVQTAAQQLGGTGIRINAICPGLIETGMTKPMYDVARERGQEQPHRRAQSTAARRRARGDRPRRAVSRLGRVELRQRHCARGRRRAVEQPSRRATVRTQDALGRNQFAEFFEVDVAPRYDAYDRPVTRAASQGSSKGQSTRTFGNRPRLFRDDAHRFARLIERNGDRAVGHGAHSLPHSLSDAFTAGSVDERCLPVRELARASLRAVTKRMERPFQALRRVPSRQVGSLWRRCQRPRSARHRRSHR